MRDHAVRGNALGGRHLPFVGGGLDEHHARSGATLAHVFLRLADALAAGGLIVLPDAVARDIAARAWIFPRHLRPVALELFGHQLRQAGEGPLTHIDAGDADNHGVIRLHHHPGVDLGRQGGLCGRFVAERKVQAKGEAGGGRADQERTAIDLRDVIHDCLHHAFAAAAWMPARTR